MSLCPNIADEDSPRNKYHVYSREFQSMLDGLDEEGCMEESAHVAEKKRRLGVNQVKTLEKSFEVENKLEPERKLKLAEELGLQPRQVAVWFQNRRARWKTKQIERDYGVLKANYEALKLKFDTLQRDNEGLSKEIRELKAKLNEENTESNISAKEETGAPSTDDEKAVNENHSPPTPPSLAYARSTEDLMDNKYDSFENYNNGGVGSSDSDSSAILNEDTSPNRGAISSSGVLPEHQLLMSSTSSINCFQFSKAASYQTQFVKMEEHDFFSGEEACNFFSDEQAPSLQWYCPDPWT